MPEFSDSQVCWLLQLRQATGITMCRVLLCVKLLGNDNLHVFALCQVIWSSNLQGIVVPLAHGGIQFIMYLKHAASQTDVRVADSLDCQHPPPLGHFTLKWALVDREDGASAARHKEVFHAQGATSKRLSTSLAPYAIHR